MKRASKVFSIIICSVLTFSLTSCASPGATKDTIRLTTLYKSQSEKFTSFNDEVQKHTGIRLKVDYIIDDSKQDAPQTDIWALTQQRLHQNIQEGKSDLIAGVATPYLFDLVERKQIDPLDDYMVTSPLATESLYAPVIDTLKKVGNGKLYALSPTFNTNFLMVNEDLFNRMNIPVPYHQMTWDEFRSTASRIQRESLRSERPFYPVSFGPGAKQGFFTDFHLLADNLGLPILNASQTEVYPDHDKWLPVFEEFFGMYRSYGLGDASDDEFYRGKVGMKIAYTSSLERMYNEQQRDITFETFKFRVLPPPVYPHQKNMAYLRLENNLMIPSNAKNKHQAWEVIKYAMSKESAQDMIQKGMLPFAGDFTTFYDQGILGIYKNKYPGVDPRAFYYGKTGALPARNPSYAAYMKLQQLEYKYFYQMLDGKLPIEDGLDAIKAEYQ